MKTLLLSVMLLSLNTQSQELLYKVKDKLSLKQQKELSSVMSDYNNVEATQKKRKKSRFANRMSLKTNSRRSSKSTKEEFKNKMQKLKESGLFDYVEENTIEHEIAFEINDPDENEQWHHPKIETINAWDFTQGSESVIVAVCDSGVDADHEDLIGRVLPGYNFVNNNTDSSAATSHGTMVAGLIAANANNGKGGFGIAPLARILPLRITNTGSTFLSTIVECIEYAADNGAHVINVSFTGFESNSIQAAGAYAKSLGAIVVYAAGNQGSNRSSWPDHKDVLAVGSTTTSDIRSSFSNYGTFIDLVAPGSSVYTTTPNSRYSSVSGTSFSAPIVASAAALLYSLNSDITPDEVESFLVQGAEDLRDEYVYGAGLLNINESVRLASEAFDGNRSPSSIIEINEALELIAPVKIDFKSLSIDPDGSIAKTEWKINGETIEGENAIYQFSLPGTYIVTLVVTDNEGKSSSSQKILVIKSLVSLKLSVADIDLTVFYTRSRARTEAEIQIVDSEGSVVANAQVIIDIDGEEVSATTDSFGVAFFSTDYESRSHRFYYEVLDVKKDSYTYDLESNIDTSANIKARSRWWFW